MIYTLKQQEQTESQISDRIAEYLDVSGWFYTRRAQDIKTRRQLAGEPDIDAHRHDVTLLIEVKTATGKRRPSQVRYYERIKPHLGPHLLYVVARDVSDVAEVIGDRVI